MMSTLRVNDLLKDPILVSRESARLLEGSLRAIIGASQTTATAGEELIVTVDFDGVAGIAPSFLDEVVSVFESLVTGKSDDGQNWCLTIANPPTRLSSKFEAIARGHGMTVQATPDGSWLLTSTKHACE